MTQVAIYVRVSKETQDYYRQVSELKDLAANRGYTVTHIISEKVSGVAKKSKRLGIKKLLKLAKKKKFSKVLISEASRLGRETVDALLVVKKLHKHGVSILCLDNNQETLLDDGSVNSMGLFLFTLQVDMSRIERDILIKRIKSGLKEAKKKGVVLGRKKGSVISDTKFLSKYQSVVEQLNQKMTIRDIAAACKVGTATVLKVKKRLKTSIN